MFSCVAGTFHAEVPSLEDVRSGLRELWTACWAAGRTAENSWWDRPFWATMPG
ncbi:hypothetical protein SVIOM342S_06157 [Streptomyces violaceorubidus]